MPPDAPPIANVYLKTKIEERTSQSALLDNLTATAAREGRDMTDAERATYDDITKRLKFLDAEVERIVGADAGAAKFLEVYGRHREAVARSAADAAAREAARRTSPQLVETRTWGEQFVASRQFKAYRGHGSSEAFVITGDFLGGEWGGVPAIEERAEVEEPGGEAGDNGPLSWNFPPGANVRFDGFPRQVAPVMTWAGPTQPTLRTPLFDVIGRVPTSMGSVEYWYWHPQLGEDEPMAEEVPEGELKPEAELGGELLAVPISTYAWWKGITRQALDDVPQIRAVVDGFLRRGVVRKINAEAGTALATNTDIPTLAGAGTEMLAVLRAALAYVDMAGYSANSVLLNPMDWAAIDMRMLELTGNGAVSTLAFWGLRPIALPGVPTGTAYVGDMAEAMNFFDRQQVSVIMTDSHADYFLRNKLVVLAEARGKVVVTNSAAIVKVTGDVPSIALSAPVATLGGAARARRARQRPAQRAQAVRAQAAPPRV